MDADPENSEPVLRNACRGIVEDVMQPSPLRLAERVYVAGRRRA